MRNNNNKKRRKTRKDATPPSSTAYQNSLRFYNYSSAAVEVMPVYEPVAKPAKSPAQKARSRTTTHHRFMLIFYMVLIFVGAMTLMMSFANVRAIENTKKGLDKELAQIKQDNEVLKSQIINETDLDYIRAYATQNLGMDKPAAYQIKTVKIKKTSYTELFEDKKYSVKQNSFMVELQSFADYLSKMVKGVIDSV